LLFALLGFLFDLDNTLIFFYIVRLEGIWNRRRNIPWED